MRFVESLRVIIKEEVTPLVPEGTQIPWPLLTLEPAVQVGILNKVLPRVGRTANIDFKLTAGGLVAIAAAAFTEPGLAQGILGWGGLAEVVTSFYLLNNRLDDIRFIMDLKAASEKRVLINCYMT